MQIPNLGMLWADSRSLYIVLFLFGTVIGSFLNVCILRIPRREDIVKMRSRCLSCGGQLRWYDMVPIGSYFFLHGRCRFCKAKLSVQYPLVEAANGILYVTVVLACGVNAYALLCCLLASALLVLSVIDFRTYEIPIGVNIFILVLGLFRAVSDYAHFFHYLAGFLVVSGGLSILYYASGGKAIGGGDVKMTAACGLFLGWKLIILAFVLGCILGAFIHVIRMKVSGAGHVLAMGPYLSGGVLIAALWGDRILSWYLGQF